MKIRNDLDATQHVNIANTKKKKTSHHQKQRKTI